MNLKIANMLKERIFRECKDFVIEDNVLCSDSLMHGIEKIESKYYLFCEKFIPGVNYYPDGSGEPDDFDYVEISEHDNFIGALRALFIREVNEMINDELLMYQCQKIDG